MAPRANWKGFLKLDEVVCPIALYTAASSSDRITFHTINRATGNRIRRQFIDSETGDVVESEDQVKGYPVSRDDYVMLEPEEVAEAVPQGDKTMAVSAFVRCADVDDLYFDRPYYLAPADRHAEEAYLLIRDGMRAKKVAAIAEAVLFRRLRKLLIRPQGAGLVATMMHFDYEVRSAANAFDEVPELSIKDEMLDLARHIIETKSGHFDPKVFDDRYEAALADLVKAKIEGRKIQIPKRREADKVVDLMAALRESAALGTKKEPAASRKKRAAAKTKAPAKPAKARPSKRKAG